MRTHEASAALVLSLWLLLLLPASRAQEVVEQVKVLTPVADSHVISEGPDNNWGLQWFLWVEGNSEEILTYLKFDLSDVPSDAVVNSATLKLFTKFVSAATVIAAYYCPTNDWTEDGITYNNKPQFSPDPLDSVNVTETSRSYWWNVTSAVQSTFEPAKDKKLTLVLKAETSTNRTHTIEFFSKNTPYIETSQRPLLTVSYLASPSSGNNIDPALILLITIVIGAAAITLTVAYTRLKKRKHAEQRRVNASGAL